MSVRKLGWQRGQVGSGEVGRVWDQVQRETAVQTVYKMAFG